MRRHPNRPIPLLTEAEIARFWSRVDRRAPDECWNWTAGGRGHGYGSFRIQGHDYQAHRVANRIVNGDTLLDVLHHCDNKPCCNPHHFFHGDIHANQEDKIRKGRQTKGWGVRWRKLTNSQVRQIRRRYRPARSGYAGGTKRNSERGLAREFGVAPSTIFQIVHRSTFAWLD